MSVECNWGQDITSCVTSNNNERPTTELSLAKPINGSPLTLTVAGHCTKCTVVSSCRTVECYVRGGYHTSVRGDVIEKRDSYTVYSATVAPDSPDTSLKLLSNSCQAIVWLVQCTVVQGADTEPVSTSSRINKTVVQDMLSDRCKERSEGVFRMMEGGGGMGSLMASLGGGMLPLSLLSGTMDNPLKALGVAKQGPTMVDIQTMLSHKPEPPATDSTAPQNPDPPETESTVCHKLDPQGCNCESSLKQVLSQQAALQSELIEMRVEMRRLREGMEEGMLRLFQAVQGSHVQKSEGVSDIAEGVSDIAEGVSDTAQVVSVIAERVSDIADVRLEDLQIEQRL